MVFDDDRTLDVKGNDEKRLPGICVVTHVESKMPSEAAWLQSQRDETYCHIVMNMVVSKPSWVVSHAGMLFRKASVDECIQTEVPARQ